MSSRLEEIVDVIGRSELDSIVAEATKKIADRDRARSIVNNKNAIGEILDRCNGGEYFIPQEEGDAKAIALWMRSTRKLVGDTLAEGRIVPKRGESRSKIVDKVFALLMSERGYPTKIYRDPKTVAGKWAFDGSLSLRLW